MKWKAGAGIERVNTYDLVMLAQKVANQQGTTTVQSWVLPQGLWWKVNTVSVQLDATNATTAIPVSLEATNPAFASVIAVPLTTILPLTFDGVVVIGRGLDTKNNLTAFNVTAPWPDMWLAPGTTVTLRIGTVVGFVVAQNTTLWAEGAELVQYK